MAAVRFAADADAADAEVALVVEVLAPPSMMRMV